MKISVPLFSGKTQKRGGAYVGTKSDSFAYCLHDIVNVRLFYIAHHAIEIFVDRFTIYKHLSFDFTICLSLLNEFVELVVKHKKKESEKNKIILVL